MPVDTNCHDDLLHSFVLFNTNRIKHKNAAIKIKRDTDCCQPLITTSKQECEWIRVSLRASLCAKEMQSGAADLKEVCQLGVAVRDVGLLGGQG